MDGLYFVPLYSGGMGCLTRKVDRLSYKGKGVYFISNLNDPCTSPEKLKVLLGPEFQGGIAQPWAYPSLKSLMGKYANILEAEPENISR